MSLDALITDPAMVPAPLTRAQYDAMVAVIGADDADDSQHPDTAHLVVEVSYSSQGKDLVHKARIYASGGFGEYWVLDIPRRGASCGR